MAQICRGTHFNHDMALCCAGCIMLTEVSLAVVKLLNFHNSEVINRAYFKAEIKHCKISVIGWHFAEFSCLRKQKRGILAAVEWQSPEAPAGRGASDQPPLPVSQEPHFSLDLLPLPLHGPCRHCLAPALFLRCHLGFLPWHWRVPMPDVRRSVSKTTLTASSSPPGVHPFLLQLPDIRFPLCRNWLWQLAGCHCFSSCLRLHLFLYQLVFFSSDKV